MDIKLIHLYYRSPRTHHTVELLFMNQNVMMHHIIDIKVIHLYYRRLHLLEFRPRCRRADVSHGVRPRRVRPQRPAGRKDSAGNKETLANNRSTISRSLNAIARLFKQITYQDAATHVVVGSVVVDDLCSCRPIPLILK